MPNENESPVTFKTFNINRKRFFLTYSQCPISKPILEAHLLKLIQNYNYIMIAREQHKDGNYHLHVIIDLKKEKNIKNSRFFDIKHEDVNYHPNILPVRNIKYSIGYLRKSDKSPTIVGEIPKEIEDGSVKKSKVSDEIAKRVMDGDTIQSVIEDYPGFGLLNLNKLQNLKTYVKSREIGQSILPWRSVGYRGNSERTGDIVKWINENIGVSRKFKQQQIYIHGETNTRKTSLVQFLAQRCRIYYAPHEPYFDGYEDDSFDIAVFDEFTGSNRDFPALNMFLDGSQCSLKARYYNRFKQKNIACVILSNYSVNELTRSPVIRETLCSRIIQITLEKEPIDLDNIYYITENENDDNVLSIQ